MLRIVYPVSNRVYYLPEGGGAPVDMCAEGYRLESDIEILFIGGKWVDYKDNEYTPVEAGAEIIGFNKV